MSYTLKIRKPIVNCFVSIQPQNMEIASNPVWDKDIVSVTLSEPGIVEVSITAEDYEDYGQTINLDRDLFLTPQLNRYVGIEIVPTPSDAKVIIEYNGKQYNQRTLDKIIANTTVSYIVSRLNKETVSDSIVLNESQCINVVLEDKIVSDGNIGKYESGLTDEISSIKLISEEDFNNLSDDMKERYVQYDPKLSNFVGVNYTKAMTDALTQIYFMSPIASKISALTQGSLDSANFYFIQLIKQLGPIAQAAQSVGNKIRSIRKAAEKVGLGQLIDILTTAFQLIGGLAGIVYAQINNPGNLIKPYAEAFKDIDIGEILKNTVGQTIPQLQYAIDAMQGKPIPDTDIKAEIMNELNYVMEVSGVTEECMYALSELQKLFFFAEDIEESIKYLLLIISTMGTGWAMGDIVELIEKLGIDYETIRHNFKDNKMSKSIKFTKQNVDKSLTKEKKYIDKQDLNYLNEINKKNNEQEEEYLNGYKDALENASKGETEEQMKARINKYISELEQLGKDYSMYVNGYKSGWKIGSTIYNNYIENLNTEEQRTSYQNGYNDGYTYSKNVRDFAYNYLNIGTIYGFVDIDNHIHDYNDTPIGKINENNEVISFPDEENIGSYDEKNNRITINNIEYVIQNNIIVLPVESPTITEDNIISCIEFLYKYMLTMIERSVPGNGNINPYYSRGWKDGYNDRNNENQAVSNSVIENNNGNIDGYNKAANDVQIDDYEESGQQKQGLRNYLKTLSSQYYKQGVVYGYNDYQSKYNSGYSQGFYTYSNEPGSMTRQEFLIQLCDNYGLDYDEQIIKGDNEKDPVFRGASEGWDDCGSNIENPNWRNSYYDSF